MMEEAQNKQSKLQAIIESIKETIFSTMLELLKEQKAGKWYASLLMVIMFIQMVGFLFDPDNNFPWKDDYLLDVFKQVCQFARLMPTIEINKSVSFFWILYFFGIFVVTFIIALLAYTIYSISIKKFYFVWPLNLLKVSLTFLYWVLFCPILEAFLSVFRCDNGKHIIDGSLQCYQGVHIVFVVLSIVFILLLLLISVLIALFYNETQPFPDDAFARLENSTEILILLYRAGIIAFSTFVFNTVGNWVLICVFILGSILLTYQYFAFVPYFNSFVSVFWGSVICSYCWISLNALLMMLINVYGHIIIICIGIPIIAGLVMNLREMRIQQLLLLNMEKMKTESDALIHIMTVHQMIKAANANQAEDVSLIGIVNLHVLDCQIQDCPCKNEADLFDAATGKFSLRNVGYHKDPIFLNHFNKRIYEESISKFINSPMLNVAFSFYLFDTMKNIHAALVELNESNRKKPSLQQQFTIYRYKNTIENSIKAESMQAKDIYTQLTNVTEFEKLLGECQKAIEKVCNFQIEFWSQISNQLPDLNILNDLGSKIYLGTQEAEEFWIKLCKINPNYSKALTLYGNYMVEIKNHNQVGYELLEKAKVNTNKKSLDELIKSSDILFADDTVVLHVSGNKETAGRIVKTNQGLSKIFGYSKTEVMGHYINILMPSLFAKRHGEFIEKFFKTGHKTVFNTERFFFGLHRNGFCFSIKMLVKQMPSLSEGIQYVGMIRQSQSDCDYILTDTRGVIDCFSSGITSLLNLPVNLFKDSDVNVQILAPELIKIFSSTDKKKTMLEKFKEPGGQKLTFYVPKDFAFHAQSESKKNAKDLSKGVHTKSSGTSPIKKTKNPMYRDLNKDLNKHNGVAQKAVTTQQLVQTAEYKECEGKQNVKCEIQDPTYGGEHKDIEPLKMRVFKVTGISMKRAGSNIDQSSDAGDAYGYYGGSHSNTSFDWKDSKGQGLGPEELGKEAITQGLMNLVINQRLEKRGGEEKEEKKGEAKAEEPAGRREDTKTTEKVAGNTLTTESRIETLEAKPMLRMRMTSDPKTGEIRRTAKEVMSGSPSSKKEEKNGSPSSKKEEKKLPIVEETKSLQAPKGEEMEAGFTLALIRTGSESILKGKEGKEAKEAKEAHEGKEEKKQEASGEQTPKMELGNLKGPESMMAGSHVAEENTVHPQEESLFESESGKSTGKANAKEEDSKLANVRQPHPHVSANKILEEDKMGKGQGDKKAGTSIEDKNAVREKKKKDKEEKRVSGFEERKEGKEEEEELKGDGSGRNEDIVPLDKVKIDVKIAQAEKKNMKVPSMLDDVVGVSHKNTADEKKGQKIPQDRSSSNSKERMRLEEEKGEGPRKDSEKSPNMKGMLKEGEEEEGLGKEDRKLSKVSDKGQNIAGKKPGPEDKNRPPMHQRRSIKGRRSHPSKIITNPFLEGDGNQMIDVPEYRPSEEEMKVRRSLLAFEKKKNKEKKKEDKEKKPETKKNEEEKDEKDEKEEKEGNEDDEEKDEDEEEGKEEKKVGNQADDDEEENQDTQSSVTSGSTGSTMRSFYSLRAAIDEKFIPLSIRNLNCSANIVFVILFGLAIVYFVMQYTLYDKINLNIKNINYSEQRLNNLIDINLQITTMMLVSADAKQHIASPAINESNTFLYDNLNLTKGYFDVAKGKLKIQATKLKDAQTDLSLKSTQLSAESLAKINPDNVVLSYKSVPGMPATYTYTIWQAIMEIVVSSYRIAVMNYTLVDDVEDATVFFVTKNSLNNVIINLDISSGAIMDETESTRQFNVLIFLILLCVASFALVLSTGLLIPVINKVKKNKQEVLELFMHIKKNDATEELNKCRKFLGTFQANQETELIAAENEEGHEENEEGEGEAGPGHVKKFDKNRGYGTSRRKYKRLVQNLGIVMFKFIFLIMIMEGYFIMSYFLSSTFLDRVSSLTKELNQLISRLPTHSFLLLIEKLSIFKNYNLQIKNENALSYVTKFHNMLYDGEEKLLDMFSSNNDFHSSGYNTAFNNIIFSNVCQYVPEFINYQVDCEAFNQGILKKGIYSSVIKYWDYLRQLNHDFVESSRMPKDQYRYLNDAGLKVADEMQSKYLNISLNLLVNQLSADIDSFFTGELFQARILFVVYLLYLVVVYLFFWRRFVSEMQEELWKTKSVLSILSPEIIMSITEIKTFILNNSSTVFFSKSTHK